MIQVKQIEGRTYYSTERRGVEYTARQFAGRWIVSTHRKSLGRSNAGGCKHFDSVEQLAASVRAFAGLDILIAA